MPPVADDALPHAADLLLSSVQFFALRSPARSFQGFSHPRDDPRRTAPAASHDEARAHNTLTPVHLRPDKLPRGRPPRRRKPDAGSAERRPASTTTTATTNTTNTTPTSNRSPHPRPPSAIAAVRTELDLARADLARAHADAAKLADRCNALDRALADAADAARARDAALDALARDRDQLRQDRDHLAQDRDRIALDRDKLRTDVDRLRADRPSRAPPHDRAAPPLTPAERTGDRPAARRDAPFDLGDGRHARPRSPFPGRRHKSTPPTQRPLSGTIDPSPHPPPSSSSSSSSSALSSNSYSLASSTTPNDPFLTKTDSWSGAEVLVAVQDLNSEILQLAAAATELVPATDKRTHKPPLQPPPSPAGAAVATARLAHAAKDTAARLGQPFARLLATRDHAQDSVLVQCALQACAAAHAARLLAMFCVGLPAPTNALFGQLHAHMHASEPQATSSRWRALASSHLRQLYPALEEDAVSDFIDTLARSFADVFLLCGCARGEASASLPASVPSPSPASIPSPSASESAGAGDPAGADALKRQFAPQMRRIARAACRLARVAAEEIMSTRFEVVLAEPARAFDAGAMANAFAGLGADAGGGTGASAGAGGGMGGGAARGVVLCTTELGLRCATRRRALALVGGDAGASEDGMERTVLLKPKVVLDTVAQVLEHSADPAA